MFILNSDCLAFFLLTGETLYYYSCNTGTQLLVPLLLQKTHSFSTTYRSGCQQIYHPHS